MGQKYAQVAVFLQFDPKIWRFCQEMPDEIIELRYCLYNIVTFVKTCKRHAKLAM